MKLKKILIGLLVLSLSSCDIIIQSSNSEENSSSQTDSSTIQDSSSNVLDSSINDNSSSNIDSSTQEDTSSENDSSNVDSSIPEDSSSENNSSNVDSSIPEDSSSENNSSSSSNSSNNSMVSQKEYYKSLVDRSKINYSPDFVNDPNHNVSSIEIFELNDTHGAYWDDDSIVGISRVATAIKNNTVDPYGVVKIANGDMLQGTAFSNMLLGEPAIAALNEMNFDAFVIGNHEFDWGFDNLSVYKDGNPLNGELECPFLGANIRNGEGKMPDWIEPYTVVEKGNVKVGIIGIIGENLESSISKVSLGDYYFESTKKIVQEYSKILLEQEKVNILIVAEHIQSEYLNQEYVNTSEIDCIINGHDHYREIQTVNRYDGVTVPVIRSNTKNMNIGKITLNLNANKDMISYTGKHYYPEDFAEDSNLKSIMSAYYEVTKAYENEIIGYNPGGLTKQQIGIDTMTYVAKKYNADVAMTNNAGVRAAITQDNITNGLVYEALPFDNELYIAYLKGSELSKVVSGSGYYFNQSGIGNGTNVLLQKIDKNKTYTIVCVDYVATKTFFANYFNEAHGLIKTGDYIRDCAIEAITEKYKKN